MIQSIFKEIIVFVLVFLCCVAQLTAQKNNTEIPDSIATMPNDDRSLLVKDTLKINERYNLIHPVRDLEFYTYENLDTAVQDIHLYLPNENQEQLWQQATNLGQTPYLLSLPISQKPSIKLGTPQANIYSFTLQNSPFYQNKAPYTSARYTIGADTEQLFEVQHAQNFSPLISIALKYQFIGSDGAYRQQNTSINNIAANAWLKSPNKRYNLLFAYLSNNEKRKQNGGVAESDNFFATNSSFRQNINVNLGNAESQTISSDIFMQQSYDFGITKDSLDTKDSVYVYWLEPKWRLIHRFKVKNEDREYMDAAPPDAFYPNYFYDISEIEDSTHLRLNTNEFLLAWEGDFNEKTTGIKAVSGVEHTFGKAAWLTPNSDTTKLDWTKKVNSFLFKAKAYTDSNFVFKKLKLATDFEYGIAGWNANNIYWNSQADYQIHENWQLKANYILSKETPDLIFWEYHSANHNWQNELNSIRQNSLKFTGIYKDLISLSYRVGQLKNYTYFDEFQEPVQISSNIPIQEITLKTYLPFKQHFHWRNNVIFQQENSNEIAIPKLWLQSDVYFEGKVFKNALEMQAGLMLNYITDYRANKFSPSLGNFYNELTPILRQYPLADFFVNLKIKRATIFVRSYNLLQGLPEMEGMFAHPDYPLPDRAFKFGFSWGFYD